MSFYVHDSSDTNLFSYISNLRVGGFRCSSSVLTSDLTSSLSKQQYSPDHIPTPFVATKSDLPSGPRATGVVIILASLSAWVTFPPPYQRHEVRPTLARVVCSSQRSHEWLQKSVLWKKSPTSSRRLTTGSQKSPSSVPYLSSLFLNAILANHVAFSDAT